MKCLHNRINKHRKNSLRVSCNNNTISSYSSLKRIEIESSKKILIVLVYMLLSNSISHLNAQSCSLCKINHTLRVKNQKTNYEEFIFEHQVTRQEAIDALRVLNESFFDGSSANSCKSITCTRNVMKYCYGPQFINDHCWCELGHSNEGLPFVPHVCYVGDKQYQASVGSCFFYEEVKECCCAPALAKKWKYLSGGTAVIAFPCLIIAALVISATNT